MTALSTIYFLRSTLYFWPSTAKNRDDRMPIELFIAGVRGWDAGLQLRLNDGKDDDARGCGRDVS